MDEPTSRIIAAELRAAALSNGMIRPELSKVLPTRDLTLDARDTLQYPENYWQNARAAMPELFRHEAATSTSSTARAPSPAATTQKRAADMTDSERRAWKLSNGINVPHWRGR